MAARKSIGIVLSEDDQSIIAWLNMLQKAEESPRTWVQAVLLADSLNCNIDVGTVYVQKKKIPKPNKPTSARYMMFGDDTINNNKKPKRSYGWSVKGNNNEYIAGKVFCFSVSRAALFPVLDSIYARCSNISSYVKAVLRKYIKVTENEDEEIIPDKAVIQDLFALNTVRRNEECDVKTETLPQKQKNGNIKQQQENKDETAPAPSSSSAPTPVIEKPIKAKNPLLQYIN